ncbi:hypothetical protein PS1_024009 [Malus domestica]
MVMNDGVKWWLGGRDDSGGDGGGGGGYSESNGLENVMYSGSNVDCGIVETMEVVVALVAMLMMVEDIIVAPMVMGGGSIKNYGHGEGDGEMVENVVVMTTKAMSSQSQPTGPSTNPPPNTATQPTASSTLHAHNVDSDNTSVVLALPATPAMAEEGGPPQPNSFLHSYFYPNPPPAAALAAVASLSLVTALAGATQASIEALPKVTVAEETSAECCICLKRLEVGEEAKEMPCNHRFHPVCIDSWLERRPSCPLCRFSMPTRAEAAAQGRGHQTNRWDSIEMVD